MKSSIATTSTPFPSFGPSGALPSVILTRETIGSPNEAPRNDTPLFAVGAKKVPSDKLLMSKNSKEVVFARSTSVKTAPKPLVSAGGEARNSEGYVQ